MKLLILTQAVDTEDTVLGFFVRWIEEFAKHAERVEIVCLREGKHDLPANVRVHSLGKESTKHEARSTKNRITYTIRFLKLIWKLRNGYDTVFVHMNPEYAVLGGVLWRLMRKRIGLWYTHKNSDLKLRVATLLVQSVFTASREGFPLKTPKLHVMGHGIDTAIFHAPIRPFAKPVRIVSVGRITPIKKPDTLIEAAALLKERGIDATVTFIGTPARPSDEVYLESLKALAEEKGVSEEIQFAGGVPYTLMPEKYRDFDISVNLCPTGGMDKAVLESMAAGLLVFASNRAFTGLFGSHASELMFEEGDAAMCAEKIAEFVLHEEKSARVRADLQQQVEIMSVQALVPRILSLV